MDKENLINSLVLRLVDKTGLSVSELKTELSIGMYDWHVDKIENTELSVGDGTVTMNLLQYFCIGKKAINIKDETLKHYVNTAQRLCDFCHKELNMITDDDVRMFLYVNQSTGKWTDGTAEVKRHHLNSIFTYLYQHKQIQNNPMGMVDKIKCAVIIKKPLTDAEMEKIKVACNKQKPKRARRDMALIYFLADSGVRVSELCNITLGDVDFANREVLIRNGKESKDRIVGYTEATAVRLEEYFKDRDDIINHYSPTLPLIAGLNKHHNKLTKNGVDDIIRKLRPLSGVNRVTPHYYRRSFATNASRRGVPTQTIAQSLGHSNMNTVNRYINMSHDDTLREIRRVM